MRILLVILYRKLSKRKHIQGYTLNARPAGVPHISGIFFFQRLYAQVVHSKKIHKQLGLPIESFDPDRRTIQASHVIYIIGRWKISSQRRQKILPSVPHMWKQRLLAYDQVTCSGNESMLTLAGKCAMCLAHI